MASWITVRSWLLKNPKPVAAIDVLATLCLCLPNGPFGLPWFRLSLSVDRLLDDVRPFRRRARWFGRGWSFNPFGDPSGKVQLTAAAPKACPTCRSSSIITKAKKPDASSYWRCTSCGEIWNQSRHQIGRSEVGRWR
jgi:hypothetical protein